MTSYDYDAPLTEDGQITEKYRLFKEVVSRYRRFEEIPLTTKIRRKAYGEIPCSGKTDLFSAIGKMAESVYSTFPLSMEDMGQSYGYILYRLKIRDDESVDSIRLENAADRVICCHDGQYVYTAFAENMQEEFKPRVLQDVV